MHFRVAAVFGLALALGGSLYWSQRGEGRLKVSGFLEADEIRVGSRLGGRVKSVNAAEGQRVRPGDVLVELEAFDLKELRDQAAATLAERMAEYEKRKAGNRPEEIAQAEAKGQQIQAQLQKLQNGPREQEIAAAQSEYDLSDAELKRVLLKHRRVESLYGKGVATSDEFDAATSELSVARSRLQVRSENLKLLKAGTRPEEIDQAEVELREALEAAKMARNGFRAEDVTAAQAAVEAAKAALAAVEKQLAELTIVSPIDGNVESVDLQPGDLVGANAPAVSLSDISDLWVRAYVPEARLSLQIGQELRVTVDSFPGRSFRGKVAFIARQAEFTPGNVQTPEERSKQVFRIKVTLLEGQHELRPGMAADVWLENAR